jgi:hypothetical protein
MDDYIRQRNHLINQRLNSVNHGNNRDEANSMRKKMNEDLRKLFNGEFNIPDIVETDNVLIQKINNLKNRKAVLEINKNSLESRKKVINSQLRKKITDQEKLIQTNLKKNILEEIKKNKLDMKNLLNEAKTVLKPRLNKYDDYMKLLKSIIEDYTDLRYNPNIGPNLHPEFTMDQQRESRIQNTRYEYSIIDKMDPVINQYKNYSFETMLYAWFHDNYKMDLGYFTKHLVITLDYIRNKHPITMKVSDKNKLTFRQLLDNFTRYQELYDDEDNYDLSNMTITVRASRDMNGGATNKNFKKSKYTINTNDDKYCGQLALMFYEIKTLRTVQNLNKPSMKERLDKKLKEFIQIKKLENPYMTPSDFTFYEITNQCRIIIIDEKYQIYYKNNDKDIIENQNVIYLIYYESETIDGVGHYEWIYNTDKFFSQDIEICRKCNLLKNVKKPCSNDKCIDHYNLKCLDCKATFQSFKTYENHISDKGVFKCEEKICKDYGKQFNYKACLSFHIRNEHNNQFRCKKCYKWVKPIYKDQTSQERMEQHLKNGCKWEKQCTNCKEYFNNFNKENGILYCDKENSHNCYLENKISQDMSKEDFEKFNNKYDHYAYDIESFCVKSDEDEYTKNVQDIAKIGFINIDDVELNPNGVDLDSSEVDIYNKSNFEEFIEFLLTIKNKTIFWAHYASGYDSRLLIKKICDYDPTLISKPRFKNSKIYEFTFNKNVMFRDSFLHLPFSLDNLAKEFKLKISKSIFPYNFYTEENMKYIGDKPDLKYFTTTNISTKLENIKKMWDLIPTNNYDIDKVCNEYLINDVQLLAQCLNKYRENATEMYQINPLNCLTQGQYAIELFKWKYMKENSISFVPDSVNIFLEKSYYGGRCEAFRTQFMGSIFAKDISSNYPAVMLMDPLPSKFIRYNNLNLSGWKDCENYLKSIIKQGYTGFFKVDVITPKTLIRPLLPSKDIQGEMKVEKLIFSCADIQEHTYYIYELLKAIELGYKVVNILEECIFESSKDLFKDFIIDLGQQKKKFSEEDENGNKLYPVQRQITKLTLNSTYGKFGQRFFSQNQMVIPYSQRDKWFKLVDQERKDHILITDTIELSKCVIVKYDREQLFERKNSLALASAITAMGRLRLYEAIEHYSSRVLYCDTDSVYVSGVDDGWDTKNYCDITGFGKWDLEISNGVEFVSTGSKSYAVKNSKNDIMVKTKGFAKGLIDMSDLKFIINGDSKKINIDDLAIYNGKDIYFRDNNTKNLSLTLDKGYKVGCFILPHCLSEDIVEKYKKMCELYGDKIITEYDKMFKNHSLFSCKSNITKKILNSL